LIEAVSDISQKGLVAGSLPASASRTVRYNGTVGARLWRRLLPAAGLLLALPAGACSFSYQLGSMFGQDSAKSEATGSVASRVTTVEPIAALPNDNDLVFARAAATEALSQDGKTTSVPWENPSTGARGTVTPLAAAYNQDGFLCRDFLASYVRQGNESWLQGEGCRIHQGKWEVRAMRPWKKT
jgi:surface antigen